MILLINREIDVGLIKNTGNVSTLPCMAPRFIFYLSNGLIDFP